MHDLAGPIRRKVRLGRMPLRHQYPAAELFLIELEGLFAIAGIVHIYVELHSLTLLRQNRPTTFARSAITRILRLRLGRMTLVEDEVVVVSELLPDRNVLDRTDIHATIFFHRLAVRIAGVVDEANGTSTVQ